MMGFALDLGQLYLVRGEMQSAANSMALAAASKLIGTDASTDAATSSARLTLDNSAGFANKYFFGGFQIGQTNGVLNSEAPDPSYFASVVDATASDGAGGGQVSGAQAKHASVTLSGEAPLTFWSFLSLAAERKVNVVAKAVAGMGAPLCTACSIEPIAVAAVDSGDTVDFGFVLGTKYTLGYVCTGAPTPAALSGTTQRIPYLLLNRLDSNATVFTDEQSQLFRDGAQGVPASTTTTQSCFTVNNTEQYWVSATPVPCSSASPGQSVVSWMCGLTTRFETTAPAICAGTPELDTLSSIYLPDTDTTDVDDYTQYQGNGRRVITIPIVDTLNAGGDMLVLGFRQFLVDPVQGGVDVDPSGRNGAFSALYIGSVVPLRQGSMSGCQQQAGPGKIVLHQ